MALIIALALMTGLQGELRDRDPRLHGAHLRLEDRRASRTTARRCEAAGQSHGRRRRGAGDPRQGADRRPTVADAFITLKGIDPELEPQVTDIGTVDAERQRRGARCRRLRTSGRASSSAEGPRRRSWASRWATPSTLLTPQGTLSPMGVLPRSRPARVVGIYSLGLLEFDSRVRASCRWTFAQRLLGKSGADLIQLRVADIYEAPAMADSWSSALGRGLRRRRTGATSTPAVLGAVAGEDGDLDRHRPHRHRGARCNIIASLVLLVMEKSRDIAILKTMGTLAGARDADLHDAGARSSASSERRSAPSSGLRCAGCSTGTG